MAYVQSASTSGSSVTPLTLSVAYPSNVTAGNLLFVAFEEDSGENSGTITGRISDTRGNTWSSFPTPATSLDTALVGFNLNFFYCIANASGANTVSCHTTWSGGTFGSRASGLIIVEYSRATTKDQAVGASSSTQFALSPITTLFASELILSIIVQDDTVTGASLSAGAGFTARENITTGLLSSGRSLWMMLQDENVTSTGTYTPTYGGGPLKGGTEGTISFQQSLGPFSGGDALGSDRSIQHLTTELNHLLQV